MQELDLATDANPTQRLDFIAFDAGDLRKRLNLAVPSFDDSDGDFRQLRYVMNHAQQLGCRSCIIEHHYIDRDHIEDHSVFYSKSLHSYRNFCKRVHFFSAALADVEKAFREIVASGCESGLEKYTASCREFSTAVYLGFSVIKPLQGSPVGRTVLRHREGPPRDDRYERNFSCTRWYNAHVAGVELRVRGLAFQQQDVGVSACATTAIWSALQKTRDFEEIASATPAQITLYASRYAMPFGRAMPSEGLSIDQMCQALQATGVSPNIYRTDDITLARAYLHAACSSGIASILILKDEGAGDLKGLTHAVTVTGMKMAKEHDLAPPAEHLDTDELASDLKAVYVHDDRHGPYLYAELVKQGGKPTLKIGFGEGKSEKLEEWTLKHVIMPMHGKIRLSITDLIRISQHIAWTAQGIRLENAPDCDVSGPKKVITIANRIVRANRYVRGLFNLGTEGISHDLMRKLCTEVCMPRYVAVVSLRSAFFSPIDFLVDTTGTQRTSHCIAVVPLRKPDSYTYYMAERLAEEYASKLIA